jgi:hypothetical protein
MKLSPPLTVLAILVVGLTAAKLMTPVRPAPAPAPATRVTIEISDPIYAALALHVKDRKDSDGQPLTVARWIADLTERTAAAVDGISPARDHGPAQGKQD